MPDANDNSFPANIARRPPRRRSVLDLAPLELDCMNTLWPLGEGTVRDIRDRLAARRPRAYTTIMTIMDRLARKGIVERRKSGRAYIYRPHLTAQEARTQALGQLIDCFFDGSKEALLAQLDSTIPVAVPRALAAAASAAMGPSGPRPAAAEAEVPATTPMAASSESSPSVTPAAPPAAETPAQFPSTRQPSAGPPANPNDEEPTARIDDTLL